jgi:hypothetical protein
MLVGFCLLRIEDDYVPNSVEGEGIEMGRRVEILIWRVGQMI